MSDVSNWNNQVIEEYRANGGKLTGQFKDSPLLLLTTTGKKSGQPRTTPLSYKSDGDRLIVVASFMGAPKHPDWYLNLIAHPQVTVELGSESFNAIATTLDDAERERQLEQWSMVAEHQTKTTRTIPFVALERVK